MVFQVDVAVRNARFVEVVIGQDALTVDAHFSLIHKDKPLFPQDAFLEVFFRGWGTWFTDLLFLFFSFLIEEFTVSI